jgi:hypothetical protein
MIYNYPTIKTNEPQLQVSTEMHLRNIRLSHKASHHNIYGMTTMYITFKNMLNEIASLVMLYAYVVELKSHRK